MWLGGRDFLQSIVWTCCHVGRVILVEQSISTWASIVCLPYLKRETNPSQSPGMKPFLHITLFWWRLFPYFTWPDHDLPKFQLLHTVWNLCNPTNSRGDLVLYLLYALIPCNPDHTQVSTSFRTLVPHQLRHLMIKPPLLVEHLVCKLL
jgi:hypothetical protein